MTVLEIYRAIFKIIRRVTNIAYTRYFKIKYFPLLKLEKRVIIQCGFRIEPFWQLGFIKIRIKKDSNIYRNVAMRGSGTLNIGERVMIGSGCLIGANENIEIGNDVMIAYDVNITDTNHRYNRLDVPMIGQGITTKPIRIEDDVWIGSRAVILPGVTIGKGAIVAAGAIVNKSVHPNEVVGGVPCKVLYSRENKEGSQNEK